MRFLVIFAVFILPMRRNALIFTLPVSKRSSDLDSACPKTYITRILARKHDFKPIFAVFPLHIRRNAMISTSGFKMSSDSDSACPKTYKSRILAPKTRLLAYFSRFYIVHAPKRPDFYFRLQKGVQIRIQHARKRIQVGF